MSASSTTATLTDDAIYFASIPVFFSTVPGETLPFVASEWHEDPSSLPAALARFSLIPDPDGGLPLFHPAIPALDILHRPSSSPSSLSASAAALPLKLRQPLLKVPESLALPPPHTIQGFASGVRSALIKLEGQWYRLKGCGNNSDGFIVKNEQQNIAVDAETSYMLEFRQVRGSAFPHTAARELVMSGRVADALAPLDAAGANLPVAVMTYTAPAQLPLGPSVPVACIVERTLGDRRLGSHLLAGLELLLPLIIDATSLDAAAVLSAFPSARPRDGDCPLSTTEFVGDHVLASTYDWMGQSGVDFYCSTSGLCFGDVPRDASTLADLSISSAASAAISACEAAPCASSPPPKQFTNQGCAPSLRDMPSEWHPLWVRCCKDLAVAITHIPPGRSLLAYLFSRLGADVGACIRGMHNAGINWGTYQDATCNLSGGCFHCNAHANNLVIIPPGALPDGTPGSTRLVAALDLDMAFDAPGFIHGMNGSVFGGSGKVGMDVKDFERLQFWEYLNLMEVLVGGDSSNGVPRAAKPIVSEYEKAFPTLRVVKSALYDSMLLAFRHTYEGGNSFSPPEPFDMTMHVAAHALIRLALIIMADFTA